MQLSSRILTALAVLILAVAVVAVRAGSPGTVEAATGTIDVLNVGTCYATDTDVFAVGSCNDGDADDNDEDSENNSGYKVAERSAITKADNVFATYAIDPKTSGDEPRAIAKNADVIKISIKDTGRDKRTGKIYAVGAAPSGTPANLLSAEQTTEVVAALGDLADELLVSHDVDGDPATTEDIEDRIQLASEAAFFGRLNPPTGVTGGSIPNSGDAQFGLTAATGNDATAFPMAPKEAKGKFYWFGLADEDGDGTADEFTDLTGEYVSLDEDQSSGTINRIAPWMRVTATVPTGPGITIQYIYYQTSDEEVLFGGATKAGYGTDPNPAAEVSPVFVDDEDDADPEEQDALVLRASADGNAPAQNLWLKEKGRFSGRYEGYLRLTDADGDGSAPATDNDDAVAKSNWGLVVGAASGHLMPQAAVLGVESGPVTVSYKNSNGDIRTVSIQIDKDPPAIQIDSPAHNTASKDDSPELLGSFSDGGGSGLREDSFKVYADNRPDEKVDATPVFDLRVNDSTMTTEDRGYICVDADEDEAGACDDGGIAALRGHYAGYSTTHETYGIIASADVYMGENIDDVNGDEFKTGDAEDFEDGDASGLFDTVVRIDFPPDEEDGRRYNHIIDIQAVVMDIAGNIGFSDAEPSDPTFIHDLGTKTADRDDRPGPRADGGKNTHNVLGWYSRHLYYLDDVDPKYSADESATGFVVDADGDVVASSSGLMIAFDGKIDASTVGVGTFEVELDGGTAGTVTDAVVKDDKVYLMLDGDLEPNATPKVDLAAGQSISDLAGNESTDRRLEGIELSDGILPTFTVTLSGGSGLHEDIDGQGSSELTKEQMKISIMANEPIQGAPQFAVVCSNLTWGKASAENDVAKFASNRKGSFKTGTIDNQEPSAKHAIADPDGDPDDDSVPAAERTMCPDHTDAAETGITDDVSTFFEVDVARANRRSGNLWEFDWSNLTGDQAVEDGKLSVIVWGRDRSSYMRGSDRIQNWSSATAGFTYDTELMTAWADVADKKGELIPDNGETVFEPRPFVLLDFGDEKTKVDVTLFEIDDVDYTADLQALDDNEFVWWPDPLAFGTYKVDVEANDGANNKGDHSYSFTVKQRAPFVLDLLAGWNSISFPANPVDRALHAVFTNDAIDQVVGWNVTEPVSPWRIATRQDGVWTTSDDYATLNDVEARYGYWVHSTGFVTQAVHLAGKGDRSTDGQPNPADIPTDMGWNFVGVVDVDGDQTQDDAGETLRNSNNDPITAAAYLGDYVRAYTWDHVNNTWDVLKKDEGITIGTGVWVYYGSGVAP